MKRTKFFFFAAMAAITLLAAACRTDCPPVTPQDPDDVTGGPYEVKYKLYLDGADEASVEGNGSVHIAPGANGAGEPVELMVGFSAWGGLPEDAEYVSLLHSGLVKIDGTPGNYSVSGRSGGGVLSLYKHGAYTLTYYDVDVSVSGTIVAEGKGTATRCSPVMQTPDTYHDIALVIDASANVAADGAEPEPRSMRLEIFQ